MSTEAQITRFAFRAQLESEIQAEQLGLLEEQSGQALRAAAARGEVLSASLFLWGNDQVFFYAESLGGPVEPARLLQELSGRLCVWPGAASTRRWVPMTDVFHFNCPVSRAYWMQSRPPERRLGKVAFLRPEKIASYIYYHYQLQEERAFTGEKYKFIALHENLLFMYDERPEVIEEVPVKGCLNTQGTPKNWADTKMEEHFIHWSPEERFFREIRCLAGV